MKQYTVNEAAKELGLDPSRVRLLLREERLKGHKWGRDWVILSLEYERQRKKGGGRKPKGDKK